MSMGILMEKTQPNSERQVVPPSMQWRKFRWFLVLLQLVLGLVIVYLFRRGIGQL